MQFVSGGDVVSIWLGCAFILGLTAFGCTWLVTDYLDNKSRREAKLEQNKDIE